MTTTTQAKQHSSNRFLYGEQYIDFERIDSNNNTQKVTIQVHYDGRVTATAPKNSTDTAVLEAVKKRSRWIYKQLLAVQQQQEHITPRQYVSGETHYYLGRQYQLKIINEKTQPQGVKLIKGRLVINTTNTEKKNVKRLLDEWYKNRARIIFEKRLLALLPQTPWANELPNIKLRMMKKQWGNCSYKGAISLNTNLIKTPRICIDYVILHELCHIKEHNHSTNFYRLMDYVMPQWQEVKQQLDAKAYCLLQ
ncbi:MAG: M48 family metallopeptidase [Gammaproteobacteria bacterium]|nr:M48 family metallopeptidase [Gammaproteobacteria bacterium]